VNYYVAEESAERSDFAGMLYEIGQCTSLTEQHVLINDFIALTEPMNKGIAAAMCRDFKADRNTWLDDFTSIVRESAMHLLREVAGNPDKADEIGSYRGLLHFRAKSATNKFVDSSAGFNQASGMKNLKRRRAELERTRQHFLMQGIDPTDDMLVDETNKRMLATRADAARQGMICNKDDLHFAETTENIEDHSHPVSNDSVESESELHATERHRFVIACIAACDDENPQLGQIARLWFAPALDDTYDSHPTAAYISTQVGIEASTARAKVARVRQIAQHVARERFGFRS
jgi:hypothetical protein